jgi:hypothetical protein
MKRLLVLSVLTTAAVVFLLAANAQRASAASHAGTTVLVASRLAPLVLTRSCRSYSSRSYGRYRYSYRPRSYSYRCYAPRRRYRSLDYYPYRRHSYRSLNRYRNYNRSGVRIIIR